MKLKTGKMTSKELAQWFGVSYGHYRNVTKKFLKALELYCDFEPVYGGIIISKVHIEVYDKGMVEHDKELYLKEIEYCIENQDGLSTISGMARKYVAQGVYESEGTARRRLTAAGETLFGKTSMILSFGEKGERSYIWAIKLGDMNRYRLMTEEERKLFNEIISDTYASQPEKIKQAKILENRLRKKEIDVDEYFNTIDLLALDTFKDCIFAFRDRTGYLIVRCTEHELRESMEFLEQEEKQQENQ